MEINDQNYIVNLVSCTKKEVQNKISHVLYICIYLGNRIIHSLTESRQCSLRVELENWDGVKGYAVYDDFYVANEIDGFRLRIGTYSGTIGNICFLYR